MLTPPPQSWDLERIKRYFPIDDVACAIVTTEASACIKPYHHRMPAALKPDQYENWLDTGLQDTDTLSEMLKKQIYTDFISMDPPEGAVRLGGQEA